MNTVYNPPQKCHRCGSEMHSTCRNGEQGIDPEEVEIAALKAEVLRLKAALTKIDAIRNSIIGTQKINWSAHIYPLVAALGDAGFKGEGYEVAHAKSLELFRQIDILIEALQLLRKNGCGWFGLEATIDEAIAKVGGA